MNNMFKMDSKQLGVEILHLLDSYFITAILSSLIWSFWIFLLLLFYKVLMILKVKKADYLIRNH